MWSAGCASGEEAYTLAMVLPSCWAPTEFRDRVKIYATDVDEEALSHARQAGYTEREVRGIPPELLDRYFELAGGRYVFRKDLRRSVIFGRNDLVQDAPISRIDLLVCRNTLMYFNAETQARILRRFHFALGAAGVLFLGKAEMLLSHGALFAPVDLKRRMFRRAVARHPAERHAARRAGASRAPARARRSGRPAQRGAARRTARAGRGHRGRTGRDGQPAGRAPVRHVPARRRPAVPRPRGLLPAARAAPPHRAGPDRAPHDADHRRVAEQGRRTVTRLEIQVSPLVDGAGEVLGAAVAFHDVTDARRLQDELEQANRQLETAYEELQSTNEELETTNEELQSTVEELETTNEELQSTNEELETMNEELQSTNDELQTINDELQDRTGELDAANAFLETILTSLRAGVVVLNPELQVRVWNRQAEELWGLRPEEAVGQHFLNLDIGLPTDRLRPLIRRDARRRGRPAGGHRRRGQPARAQHRGARARERAEGGDRRGHRGDPDDGRGRGSGHVQRGMMTPWPALRSTTSRWPPSPSGSGSSSSSPAWRRTADTPGS